MNEERELECFDGAMFEFNQGILKALPTVLDFIEEDINNLESIVKL